VIPPSLLAPPPPAAPATIPLTAAAAKGAALPPATTAASAASTIVRPTAAIGNNILHLYSSTALMETYLKIVNLFLSRNRVKEIIFYS
jgi:hypothetical protein